MKVFDVYSNYYNLLYKDKNYKGEAAYVSELLKKYNPSTKTILDLGCGTGNHDNHFVEQGYELTGIDLSEKMIAVAKERFKTVHEIAFLEGDVRTIRLERKFDAVISLFHVMSYQVSNNDLLSAFETAKVHLNPNGIFLFDCWYGPAVLTDRPVKRNKQLADELIEVSRDAEPVMYPNENTVDVNYTVSIREKNRNETTELKETHTMRYLFYPEISFLAKKCGFNLLLAEEWMTGKELSYESWNACFVLQLKG